MYYRAVLTFSLLCSFFRFGWVCDVRLPVLPGKFSVGFGSFGEDILLSWKVGRFRCVDYLEAGEMVINALAIGLIIFVPGRDLRRRELLARMWEIRKYFVFENVEI